MSACSVEKGIVASSSSVALEEGTSKYGRGGRYEI